MESDKVIFPHVILPSVSSSWS